METNVVEIQGVTRAFGGLKALDNIDFTVQPGCVHGLVGANGAGKTTLIKHILGLLKAKNGSVRVFGLDPVRNPVEVLVRIGYLSEERDLPEWMRIHELMRYTQAYHPKWDMDYADALIRTFELDPRQKIKTLSRGQRAQTGLIAAVAHRPDLLLLDEPSSGLDAVVRKDILKEVVRAVADEGRTALFSSHLLDEVERMSDVVTMIHKGKIVLHGELDAIKEAHWRLSIRFPEAPTSRPEIPGVLSLDGIGRDYQAVCDGGLDEAKAALHALGAEITEARNASLEEIFVARVGRGALAREEG
ncbi:MAG: ABC transporter ATP-binding protein [Candidatus Hydrogenedentes bacterium]|nr:ABC transporter ATP-binding protein [Candidatus Hydrogenedentota bacterium]